MKERVVKFLLTAAAVLAILPAAASETLDSSPWVGWRKGYEYYDKATAAKENNQVEAALENFTRSREYFNAVSSNFPQWNKSVVQGRIRLCDNEIKALKKIVAPKSPKVQIPTSRPEVYPPQTVQRPVTHVPAEHRVPAYSAPGAYVPENRPVYSGSYSMADPNASNRLYIEMQSEIDQDRRKLRNALMEIDQLQIKLQQSEVRSRDIDGILRDYRLLQEKYSLLEVQYKNARERANTADRTRYEDQIMSLKMANDEALKRIQQLEETLRTRDQDYSKSRAEVLKLRDELQQAANEKRRIQRNMELQRNQLAAAPGADKELQEKLQLLESELKRKDQRIDRLMKLLSDNPGEGVSNAAAAANEAEMKLLRKEIADLRRSSGMENTLRKTISDLTASEKSLKNELAQLNGLMKVRDGELQNFRQRERKLQDAAKVSSNEINVLSDRTAKLEKELKTYSDRYRELEKRYQDRLNADAVNTGKLTKAKELAQRALQESNLKLQNIEKANEKLRRNLKEEQEMIKKSRASIIDLKARQHSAEVELRKMAALQKAYDELKAKFDLFNQASNSDVLTALNRIPGLEESLKRYEKENSSLLSEISKLKRKMSAGSGNAAVENMELELIEDLLSDGRSAESRGNREIAIWNYRQVLARESDHQEAAVRLGNIYLKLNKADDAAKLLAAAAKRAPADSVVVNSYARALIGRKDYDQALKVLKELKKQRGNRVDADALLTEAVAWSRSGSNKEAEKTFKAVLQLVPNNAEAAYELALMLSADEKRRKEAGEFYMLAKSNGIGIDSYLEEILRSFSSTDHATRDFLLNNVADAMNENDMASAAWYLAEVKKLYPDDREYQVMLAVWQILNKQALEVVKNFKNAPTDREKMLYAVALLCDGKYDEARPIAGKLKNLPSGALPQAMKNYLHKQAAEAPEAARDVYGIIAGKCKQ